MIDRGDFTVEYIEYTATGVVLHWHAKLRDGGEMHGKQPIDLAMATPTCGFGNCGHRVRIPSFTTNCGCHGVSGSPCPDAMSEGPDDNGPPHVWESSDPKQFLWEHYCQDINARVIRPIGRTYTEVFCPDCGVTSDSAAVLRRIQKEPD